MSQEVYTKADEVVERDEEEQGGDNPSVNRIENDCTAKSPDDKYPRHDGEDVQCPDAPGRRPLNIEVFV